MLADSELSPASATMTTTLMSEPSFPQCASAAIQRGVWWTHGYTSFLKRTPSAVFSSDINGSSMCFRL